MNWKSNLNLIQIKLKMENIIDTLSYYVDVKMVFILIQGGGK